MATTTELERIIVRIMGDAQAYYDELKKAMDQTDTFAVRAQKAVMSVGAAFAGMGAAIAGPLDAIGKKSLEAFSEFNLALTQSTAIMEGSIGDMGGLQDRLTKQIFELGKQGPQPLAVLAKGYYHLASAGLDTERAMAAMPQVQKFATAGMFDLETATTLSTDALAALGLASTNAQTYLENLTRVQDILVMANNKVSGTIHDFSKALTSKAANAAAMYGQDVETVVGVLMAYAKQGIKASLAGHTFARSIQLLADKAIKNKDMFKAMGVQVFDDTGNMRQFTDIIVDLSKAMSELSDEQRQMALSAMGFEVRIQQALLPLMKSPELARQFAQEIKKSSAGESSKVSEKTMTAFYNQLATIKNQVVAAGIEIGKALAPILMIVAKGITTVLDLWNSFPKEVQQGVIAGLAFFAVFASIVVALNSFIAVVAFIGPTIIASFIPVTLMGVGLAGILALVTARMGGLMNILSQGEEEAMWLNEMDDELSKAGGLLGYIKDQAAKAWTWVEPIWQKLTKFFSAVYTAGMMVFNQLADFVVGTWNDIVDAAGVDWGYVQYAIMDAMDKATFAVENFQLVWDVMVAAGKLAFIILADTLVHFFYVQLPELAKYGAGFLFRLFMMMPEINFESIKIIVTKVLPFLVDGFINLHGAILKVLKNLGENTVAVFKAIPKLIKGSMSVEDFIDSLKPLNEGVKDVFGELDIGGDLDSLWKKFNEKVIKGGPALTDRTKGELEKKLEDELGGAMDKLGAGFADWKKMQKDMEEDEWLNGPSDETIKKQKDQIDKQKHNYDQQANNIKEASSKFDAALAGSAEAKTRMQDWLDSMSIGARKGGGPDTRSTKGKLQEQVKHFDVFNPAGGPGGEREGTNDLLKKILEEMKKAGGKVGGVDIDPADFGGGG